jgi:hypothetical protein
MTRISLEAHLDNPPTVPVHEASGEAFPCHFCDFTATLKFRRLVRRRDCERRGVEWVYSCSICRPRAEREVRRP